MIESTGNKYSDIVLEHGPINVYRALILQLYFRNRKDWVEDARRAFEEDSTTGDFDHGDLD